MHHAGGLVQEFERLCDLGDDVPRQVLAEVGEAHDLVEELAARAQLQNDKVVLPRLVEVDELYDVTVI